jgi:hypothetical protein
MSATQIASLFRTNPSSLPRRFSVTDRMVGSWLLDDVLDALATMAGAGMIAGFDGDEADDTGHGHVRIWIKGEVMPALAA